MNTLKAQNHYDLIVIGATPGGIASAIAAGRHGLSVLILERSTHIGGLPANGLGATDIDTREVAGGLFLEFVQNIRKYYGQKYGFDSQQYSDCSEGFRFEPHVAEEVFQSMLDECPSIHTQINQEIDPYHPQSITKEEATWHINAMDRKTRKLNSFNASILIDATYEGDVLAATGTDHFIGREGVTDYDEPFAGEIYMGWHGSRDPASSGFADNGIQAYNYRLCLTQDAANRAPIQKPKDYNPENYQVILEDILQNRFTGPVTDEAHIDNIGRVVNMVPLPNGKYDANNQHLAFQSTDLPEANWPWPTSRWDWRDCFANKLKDYITGLLWFVQNDPRLPQDFRDACSQWGFARDEYTDNDNFPRQVYVREGRRLAGEYVFSAADSWRADNQPVPAKSDSIAASHYSLDSHAVRGYQAGFPHLEGFFNVHNLPYTIPYGVMVPQKQEGLLAPVPVSSTHIGFSTLRMEPCWMALGHAAGLAATIAIKKGHALRNIPITELQELLLQEDAVLELPNLTAQENEALIPNLP